MSKYQLLQILRNRHRSFLPCFAIGKISLHYFSSLGRPAINVMQTAKNWLAYNLAIFLNWPMYRRIFFERHMSSADIVILEDVFVQNIVQMFFVENDHMVKALSAKRTNDSLANRILPWASRSCWCVLCQYPIL